MVISESIQNPIAKKQVLIRLAAAGKVVSEDSTYLSAVEASFMSRGFPVEIIMGNKSMPIKIKTAWEENKGQG